MGTAAIAITIRVKGYGRIMVRRGATSSRAQGNSSLLMQTKESMDENRS